jgi:alkanesulfonate monooxygenase SsuD/methylene tetrahydromethanopterin reductase-like flavin-dependent oxidoreductase (luciferase family)
MQISARTHACVAMTAATIDHLSIGWLILGIGVSGPQVVEGWAGQPFPKPLARTRELVALLRMMMERQGPVTFQGEHYPLPLKGGARRGKSLELIVRPLRAHVPIYLGAGPRARIRKRLAAWRASPVTTIVVGSRDPATLRMMAEELL